jgi:hypothetical protein
MIFPLRAFPLANLKPTQTVDLSSQLYSFLPSSFLPYLAEEKRIGSLGGYVSSDHQLVWRGGFGGESLINRFVKNDIYDNCVTNDNSVRPA